LFNKITQSDNNFIYPLVVLFNIEQSIGIEPRFFDFFCGSNLEPQIFPLFVVHAQVSLRSFFLTLKSLFLHQSISGYIRQETFQDCFLQHIFSLIKYNNKQKKKKRKKQCSLLFSPIPSPFLTDTHSKRSSISHRNVTYGTLVADVILGYY